MMPILFPIDLQLYFQAALYMRIRILAFAEEEYYNGNHRTLVFSCAALLSKE